MTFVWKPTRVIRFLDSQIWDKIFKNGPSKICGRQPLKNFTWLILLENFVAYILRFYNRSFFSKLLFQFKFEVSFPVLKFCDSN